jgi:hypothetical protein
VRSANASHARASRTQLGALAFVAVVFCAAPTVGDVGGCGREATALDEAQFSRARKIADCRRCAECALTPARCARACDPKQPGDAVFPATCHPLRHDGEVCLDALLAASCSDYASYVADEAPLTPPECDFCHDGVAAGMAP